MARTQKIFTSFTTGEISPKLSSRVDFSKYVNGCETLENYTILPQGGVTRRPGTRFVKEVKDSTKKVRLVPFLFNVTDAFILEFGENYIRFYKNQANITNLGSPVEITTTYAEADLFDLHFAQSADILYISHKDYAPRKLSRASDISWAFAVISFDPPPTFEADTDLTAALKPCDETVGTARTFIGASGSEKITNGEFASGITGWTDRSVGTGAISFDTNHMEITEGGGGGGSGVDEGIAEQNITLTAVSHTISFKVTVGALRLRIGTTSGAQDVLTDASYSAGIHTVAFTGNAGDNFVQFHNLTNALHELDNASVVINSDIFLAADVGRAIKSGAGRGFIASIVNAHKITVDITSAFSSTTLVASGSWFLENSPNDTLTPSAVGPIGSSIELTLASAGWRSTDVDKYVKVNNGMGKVTFFTSSTVVKIEVLRSLDDTSAAPGGTWTLEDDSWTSTRGYPAAVGFFEQRLFYARTDTQPQTLWGSVIDDFESFATGTNAADSLDFTLTGMNPIRWLSPKSQLSVGTYGGELVISSTSDAALSPTNVKINEQTTHGSSSLQPIRVGEVTLFVQRSRRKLREFVFVFEDDNFQAPDLTLLSDNITEGGIDDISYQQELESIVWCVRNDGQLLGMTYQRKQDVIGWHRHTTGASGLFESVATIPISNKDQTWVIVNRTVNGGVKRCVEYFDEDAWSSATAEFNQWNMLNTDSAVIYDSTATTTITGLNHLEGEEVTVVADGAAHPNKTVSSGSITLERSSTEAEVGLAYTSTLKTVKPEAALSTGSSQGRFKGWSEIVVRLLNTLGGTINDDVIETRTPEDSMDAEPPLYTDDYIVQNLGYDRAGQITVQQTQPFPHTILSITGTIDIGEN